MTHRLWREGIRRAQLLVWPELHVAHRRLGNHDPGKSSDFSQVQWPSLSKEEQVRWDKAARGNISLSSSPSPRIRREYASNFEKGHRPPAEPVVYMGLLTQEQGWNTDSFLKLLLCGGLDDAKFEVGTCATSEDALVDGEAGPVLVSGRDFFGNYIESREAAGDRNPLYIFDSSFDCDAPELLTMYEIPRLFRSNDALQCLDEDDYANWRWLLAGPARAGSAPHVDPAGTSAWNALLCGRKWWVVGEPGCGLSSSQPQQEGTSDEASEAHEALPNPDLAGWFLNGLPEMLRNQRERDEDAPEGVGKKRVFEFVQEAGEVVWVPAGWEHAVINLDFAVAITHNMVELEQGLLPNTQPREREQGKRKKKSSPDLLTFVRNVRVKEPAFAKRFLRSLRQHRKVEAQK